MIIVRVWEGLGNQLFQYAYARAFRMRTGENVYLDISQCYKKELEGHRINRSYELNNFNIKLKAYNKTEKTFFFLRNKNLVEKSILCLAQKKHFIIHFYKEDGVRYKNELTMLKGNWYVMGWFQNEKYFKEYRKQLLNELKPKKHIKISSYLKSILQNENTISIHIRRSDYKINNNVLPNSYYINAINLIENTIKKPYYIIFTDDYDWVKKNMVIPKRHYYIDNEYLQDYEELWIMTKCKHNIIANSTFSWWGAWLNQNEEKIVIGPEKWYLCGENSMLNIMPDDWIKMSVNESEFY